MWSSVTLHCSIFFCCDNRIQTCDYDYKFVVEMHFSMSHVKETLMRAINTPNVLVAATFLESNQILMNHIQNCIAVRFLIIFDKSKYFFFKELLFINCDAKILTFSETTKYFDDFFLKMRIADVFSDYQLFLSFFYINPH